MFANWVTCCQSLMVSGGVSKLWCTHLIFVDPGLKINGCYYREVLLSQQLLHTIRQVSGDFLVLQVTRQCTRAHGTRDNQAAATRDARIHLTWSVASKKPRSQPSRLQNLGSDARSGLTEKVKDVNELRERLVEVWAGMQQNAIDDAIDQWRRRLRLGYRRTFWVFVVTAF